MSTIAGNTTAPIPAQPRSHDESQGEDETHGQASERQALALPRTAVGAQATGWWGMVMLITNEAVLFAALIASYFYLRFNAPVWPIGNLERPELLLPIIMTVVLLASSVAMHLAQGGLLRGEMPRLHVGLALAFLLGLIFLGLQAYEFRRSLFAPQSNVYGSLFFTITGIHGLHVLVGLILNGVIQARVRLGHFNQRRYLAVENVVLYWHFVDVVWLFVFSSLYLSAYL